ncbi:cytochrome P450 [Pseudonocardia asaccharolytica DSM 44247 = NBRC 16224]|uniref:Cytochrome P450 n=2 Tax=Pseudonocardia asaccharolytica TaxID=54010 RepID=A0A511CX62_9PSEU|nr:cytochrome P450 [Pseudonocardia asaccharolytica DSM 44247 = NBRC 16224]
MPADAPEVEVFTGAFWNDPYHAYAVLRATQPVREVRLPDGPLWLVSRYDDVKAAFSDPRLSKDWRHALPPEQRVDAPSTPIPMIIMMDPPDHTRLRKLVSRSFTPRRMAALRSRVEQIAEGLLDALPAEGVVDLIAEYAFPLPVQVICELLGVPAADRDEFGHWSSVMIDESPAEEKMAASESMARYLGALIERKRAEPDHALLAALAQVSDEDGDRLSPAELVGMAMLLLIAGHETTTNLIGNGVAALLAHPDQLVLLRERPALLPGAIEEILRWDSPVATAPVRFAAEDIEIAGTTIPAGATVALGVAAANRDERRFPDAERFDITRDAGGHLAFGHGVHFCLGSHLARIEGEAAIGALLARRPGLRLAVDPADLEYRHSTVVRGLRFAPVRVG